ncbi:MAG: hypothetical protein VX466_03005 [Myxococcota bacterium]|nr:hypothetical protein [Myxococcota bacterium]
MLREASTKLRTTLRALGLVTAFAVTAAALVAGSISWLKDARLGRPTVAFNYSRMMGKWLPALAEAGTRNRQTIAFLGDSSIISYPEGRTVPERVQQLIDARSPDSKQAHVASLAMSGAGPFDYYFLADRIAAARPDLVVIGLNLDHFSTAWQGAYSRPQLAALIEPGRLVEALSLPLHWTGLTTDRLLFYLGVVQAGGYDAFYWLTLRQAQVGRARARFEAWLQGGAADTPERAFRERSDERTLARLFTGPDIRHYSRAGLLEHYRPTLAGLEPDHPVLQVLAATVARFRSDDVAVLVYLAPVEVSWLESQAVLDRHGLARTLAVVRQAVESTGGEFADLHDLLPADAFRDAPGHLAIRPAGETEIDGPLVLADALAPLVIRSLD